MRRGRNTQSVGSPSTLGAPTPTSTDIPPTFPLPNPTDRASLASSNAPSRLPTPIRRATAFHPSTGHLNPSNTTAATQVSSQHRHSHSTNYDNESRTNGLSSINPSQQQTPQNSKDTAIPISSPSGDLNPTSMSEDEMFNMDDGLNNCQLIPTSSHRMPPGNEHFENHKPGSFTPIRDEAWLTEPELDPAPAAVAWDSISNVGAGTLLPG